MAKEIRLPQLGQTMEEGTIVSCPIKVGDKVQTGDRIFEIETDKATLEMESPADGFVKHILVKVDQTIPVGTPLLILGNKSERLPKNYLNSIKTVIPAKLAQQTVDKEADSAKTSKEELLTSGKKAEVKLGGTFPFAKKQKLIAERMLKSKREIPCFYLTVRADVTGVVELSAELNETADAKITYNDFFIKAVAAGLQKFPLLTGRLVDNAIKLSDSINIGLAVEAPDGLLVPVIKDADKKDLKQIAADTKAIIEKAQSGTLLLTDLEGACITISNLGALGINSFIPIVIPGQCCILGIGRITDTCVSDNSGVIIRKIMNMTLSVDHKIANGAYAAQFLDFTRKFLEDASNFS